MKLYKLTAISAVLTFISGIVMFILNPMPKRNAPLPEPTLSGDISVIITAVFAVIFIVLLAISYTHNKIEATSDVERTTKFQIFALASKYDEKYDSALTDKKEEHEKHKFD